MERAKKVMGKEEKRATRGNPPFNFHHLWLFTAVAEQGSLSAAAEMLSMSQPALSRQIQNLEREAGVILFERHRRGVYLTEAGEIMRTCAREIFDRATDLHNALEDLQGLQRGQLLLGASSAPSEYLLTSLLPQFCRQYPGVRVRLDVSNTATICARLRHRTLDLGFIGSTLPQTDDEEVPLRAEPFCTDELVLCVAAGHPLAQDSQNEQLSAEALSAAPFILREAGSATREIGLAELRRCGVTVRVQLELGSTEAVRRAILAGLGIGLLSRVSVEAEVATGQIHLLRLMGWNCGRPLFAVFAVSRWLSPAQQAFLQLVRAAEHTGY